MKALGAIFGAAVDIRNRLYDRGDLRIDRLQGPVVSIGNISLGGAGKTPFLILLGEMLQRRGVKFDVLSRGYRRETSGVRLVDPEGAPEEFGDEPLLIARKLRVPVIVGEERYGAGQLAEEKFGPQLHLLDDGFQHRKLARDFDIVLVSPQDLSDRLIPAGRLREPPASLTRADAMVIDADASYETMPPQAPEVWRVRRKMEVPDARGTYVAFCAIARPEAFFAQLRTTGIDLIETRCFRDHHRYTKTDVQRLLELRQQTGATGFLTTEKDWINLGSFVRELEPVRAVRLQMELLDSDQRLNRLVSCIARVRGRRA